MNVKRSSYKCMPGGNSHNRPILMKDGKVIDQEATVIEDKVIADGMRYIAKMAKGLATGVLSQDEEYIKLQNRVMEGLIKTKSSETRTKIEKEARKTINQYADAHKCHQRVLDQMYAQSKQIAADNSLSFYVNDENEVYQISSTGPIGCVDKMGGGWKRIDLKELKKNIDERNARAAELRKKKGPQGTHEKIDDALNKFNSKKKKTKKKSKVAKPEKIADIISSKAKRKPAKKKIAKKKTARARKRDRR